VHLRLHGIVNAEQLHADVAFGKSVCCGDTLPVGRDYPGLQRAPTGTRFDGL
jgi:hypothetical protein